MARLSDVAEVRRLAAPFAKADRAENAHLGEPLLLLVILAVLGLPTLLLVAAAVGWRNDVAVLLVLAGAGVGYYLRGPR